MRNLTTFLSLVLPVVLAFCSGCASTKPIPREYFEPGHNLGLGISKIPDKPKMRDSGQGGLIGLMVNAGRGGKMRERMTGIQGETVKELLRQQLTDKVQTTFPVVEKPEDLKLDVQVLTYGWFCKSTVAGIRTGAYQFEIIASLVVDDLKQKKKKVAFAPIIIQKPLGNNPGEADVQNALIQAATEFADRAVAVLFADKNKPLPPVKDKKKEKVAAASP